MCVFVELLFFFYRPEFALTLTTLFQHHQHHHCVGSESDPFAGEIGRPTEFHALADEHNEAMADAAQRQLTSTLVRISTRCNMRDWMWSSRLRV